MSKEILAGFFKHLENNLDLQEQLRSATSFNNFIEIARKSGFDISAGELIRFQAQAAAELSDNELESISGGGVSPVVAITLKFWLGGVVVAGVGAVAYSLEPSIKNYPSDM